MKCEYCGKENCESQDCVDHKYEDKASDFFNNCPHRNKEMCPGCDYVIECMDNNLEHRIKRGEYKAKPGETYVIDGVEYHKPKQACVNCDNLGFHDGSFFCTSNSGRGNKEKVNDLTKDQSKCDFWRFKENKE